MDLRNVKINYYISLLWGELTLEEVTDLLYEREQNETETKLNSSAE
jgi:hypothetical protein